jgi:hypothetical protein
MAQDRQPNSGRRQVRPRPENPATNTRPRGNGDHDERDTEHGKRKLEAVLGH